MKYTNLTHKERELVLFIENNEAVYNVVLPDPNMNKLRIACYQYNNQRGITEKNFTTQNRVYVLQYLQSRQD